MKRFRLRPRWRKVLYDLWDNKARTILVVASIAIGVFAVGMIAGLYVIIANDMNGSYADANPANIEIVTAPFDDDLVKTIRNQPGIQEVEGRRNINVRVRTGPDTWDILNLETMPDFDDMRIDILLLRQGRIKPANQQVVLERNAIDKLGANLGDRLEIELSDGTRKQLPVVGIVQDRTSGVDGMVGDARGYITDDTLEWLHQPTTYTRLMITTSSGQDDKAHLQQVADQVIDQLKKSGREAYRTQQFETHKHPLDNIVRALLGVLFMLGVLIVFLSGSLIANTLSALLNQHLRQIGVMKLVGARRKQIISLYVALILCFGVIALVFAIPAGSYAAMAVSSNVADMLNVVLVPRGLIPIAILLQVVIALVAPVCAGILPVLNGSGVTVHKAINSSALETESGRKGAIDRWLEGLRGFSRPLLISLRNTFRRKGRLFLTLFNLALGGAIFISVFNVRASLNHQIERTTKYFKADVNLNFDRMYRIDEIRQLASSVPGVQKVEGWAITSAEVIDAGAQETEYVTVFGPPADSQLIDPILLEGRWLMPGDENAITVNEAFWKKHPGLRPGDTLRLKIDGTEHDWTIVGIFQYTGVDILFAYTSYDYLARVMDTPGRASSFRITTAEHSRSYQEWVSARLDERFKAVDFRVSKVQAGNTLIENVFDYIDILIAFLLTMAVLTALVGSIGLAGTLSMNVMERTREIGVMRAIGAYNKIVLRLVVVEGVFISLLSFVIGAALSFPITGFLADIVSRAIFNSPASFAFTAQGFLIWLVVVTLLSVLASAAPARSASQMTIREVLAYE